MHRNICRWEYRTKLTESFQLTQGLKQGDRLTPFLSNPIREYGIQQMDVDGSKVLYKSLQIVTRLSVTLREITSENILKFHQNRSTSLSCKTMHGYQTNINLKTTF